MNKDTLQIKGGQEQNGPAPEIAIGIHKGQVHMLFHQPLKQITLGPANAAHIGKELIDLACELGVQVVINLPRRKISDLVLQQMVARAMHIIRTNQDKGHKPEYTARAVVEGIIKIMDETKT